MGVRKTSSAPAAKSRSTAAPTASGVDVVEVAAELAGFVHAAVLLAEEGAQAVGALKLLAAHAVADLFRRHDGHRAEGGNKVPQQRRAGRGAELAAHLAAVGGHAAQKVGGGGRGHGQNPVRAAHEAASDVDGGGGDAVRADQVEEQAAADDVRDRVHRADLVEVHLLGRNAVRVGFRLGDETVNGDRVRPDLGGQIESFDQRADIGKAVVMMPVRMAVALSVFVRVRRLPPCSCS